MKLMVYNNKNTIFYISSYRLKCSLVMLLDSDLKRTTDRAIISHVTRFRSKEDYRFCTH
jgi:hypothetical protein